MFENIKTYKDFADRLGGLILCNEMAGRDIELISGELTYDEDCYYEIFQWFIIQDPSFVMDHTDELIFYDNELDLYILGVTHFGTSWDYVSAPDFH